MNDLKANSVPKQSKKIAKKTVKKTAAPKAEATFESIYNTVSYKASKAKFPKFFLATQITLKGKLECAPLYVKVEDGKTEVAPYEYNNACFYIDADTDAFVEVLNGKKKISDAIAEGQIEINGDASKAVLFFAAVF